MPYLDNADGRRSSAVSGTGKADSSVTPRRVLLLLATPGTLSESLLYAIEREFPWIVVEHAAEIEETFLPFAHPVSLTLVDAAHLPEAEAAADELARVHPLALTALIEPDEHNLAYSLQEIFGSRLIRGVLPMNLKLDVWLSVVRLMLRGGEYFPAGMFHDYVIKGSNGLAFRTALPGPVVSRGHGAEHPTELTNREAQILEMVSRGLQNKTIAAELGLSEHTVKIHLHNIISKLGVHNRTEAAARFRDFRDNGFGLRVRNGSWPSI